MRGDQTYWSIKKRLFIVESRSTQTAQISQKETDAIKGIMAFLQFKRSITSGNKLDFHITIISRFARQEKKKIMIPEVKGQPMCTNWMEGRKATGPQTTSGSNRNLQDDVGEGVPNKVASLVQFCRLFQGLEETVKQVVTLHLWRESADGKHHVPK